MSRVAEILNTQIEHTHIAHTCIQTVYEDQSASVSAPVDIPLEQINTYMCLSLHEHMQVM